MYLIRQSIAVAIFIMFARIAIGSELVHDFERRFPDDMPEIEAPTGCHTAWIARKMIRNGLPMSIRAFSSNESATEISEYFLHEWKKNALSPMGELLKEGRRRVGVLKGDYYISVESYPTLRGSEGFIVVTADPSETVPESRTELPLPRSFRVVNKDEYLDDGIVAESVTAVSDRSQRIERNELSRQLESAGWSFVNGAGGNRSSDQTQMEFQKSVQQLQVTVLSDKSSQQTVMLLHWRKN